MKLFKTVAFSAILFFVFGFKGAPKPDFIGAYGVSKNDPAKIELKINADKTFSYRDFSEPHKKIETQGNWELKNNTVILKNYTSVFPIRTKWKIEKDGMAVRSRKGISFYRFVRI